MSRSYTLMVNGHRQEVEVSRDGETFFVRIGDEKPRHISLGTIEGGRLFSLLIDGLSYEVHARASASTYDLLVQNETYHVEVARGRPGLVPAASVKESGTWALRSPMTGIVAEVAVAAGQSIERDAVLLILESMKMKNELRANQAGVVDRVSVQPGQRVERGDVLVSFRSETTG